MTTKKLVQRFDTYKLGTATMTEQGFLKAPVTATRSGIFSYRQADGSVFREYRPASEVFDDQSLASLRSIPVTLDHPPPPDRMLTSKNAKGLAVGYTSESVRQDNELVNTEITIFDQDTIDAVKGNPFVSCGYMSEVEFTAGQVNGERYDGVQRNIRYNHLAVAVPRPRAGEQARIHLDGDGAECDHIDNVTNVTDANNPKGDQTMTKVRIDSIEYEASEVLAGAVTREFQRRDDELAKIKTDSAGVATKADQFQAKLDAVTAERDTLKKRVDSELTDEAINGRVSARVKLIATATKKLDAETVKKLDAMSERDIKIAVIKTDAADFNPEGKSDVYVDARFDHIAESTPANSDNDLKRSLGKARTDGSAGTDNADEARAKSQKLDSDAWMKPLTAVKKTVNA